MDAHHPIYDEIFKAIPYLFHILLINKFKA